MMNCKAMRNLFNDHEDLIRYMSRELGFWRFDLQVPIHQYGRMCVGSKLISSLQVLNTYAIIITTELMVECGDLEFE